MILMEGKRKSNKNEASKEKKLFVALMGCIFFKRKTEKFSVSCVTARV
jgi:hypothetical protein